MIKRLINHGVSIIMLSLLAVVLLSVALYFDAKSPVLHILLALGFLGIGVGILLGFAKMVISDSTE